MTETQRQRAFNWIEDNRFDGEKIVFARILDVVTDTVPRFTNKSNPTTGEQTIAYKTIYYARLKDRFGQYPIPKHVAAIFNAYIHA